MPSQADEQQRIKGVLEQGPSSSERLGCQKENPCFWWCRLLFITLAKFKGKPTKESIGKADKLFAKMAEQCIKIKAMYWTLGMFDGVVIAEAKNEKTVMKGLLQFSDAISSETLVAVPREEAVKLVE